MKVNVPEKMLSRKKRKKNNGSQDAKKSSRFLIIINVLGSAGPIRFVVNEDDPVAAVIDTALKSYAREGRLPVLGIDANNFLLYCANASSDALSPWELIGSTGGRNFVLCKKQMQPQMTEGRSEMIARKGSGWKAWLNKSLSFKISSH
ncbi:uncharacterized protein At4g22758-like [Malania oleifera]|uniref:uncharacterized protein At4g22758-like n=1 Tax=Malania oleifera TaxID=397392 RepID=UPI0025AE021A|nr:uncharacterized protein At4g22758-like [Malania oleifera]XP_057970514.1 uncharacterized protein At4g22758-like [Malania oleifera]XP_057970515.1 uncharacterized protein At4g22758-like [Malania oleifera]XP_057970516.1 uncharacterized protein At4g22758-like [Malania oleifera]